MRDVSIILIFLFSVVFGYWATFSILNGREVLDKQTEMLCREYAYKDHRMEIGEKRYEWLSNFGNPNDTEFFYQSCISHITGIPATKEYMK